VQSFARSGVVSSVAGSRPAAALCLLLFLLTASVYSLRGAGFMYDGEMAYRVAESLLLRHSLQISDPIYHLSEPYSIYGLGLSFGLLPFVAAGWALLHDPRILVWLYQPAVTALTVVALNRLLVQLGCSWRRSLVLSLLFAFGTIAWHFTGELFSEPLIALTLTLALLWLLRFRQSGNREWLLAPSCAAGAAIVTRYDSILLVALPISVYAVHLILQKRERLGRALADLATYWLPIGAATLLDMAYDQLRYGNIFRTGYEGYGFTTPPLKGLFGLLLSPGAGLVVYVPLTLLAVIGFPRFVRRWPMEGLLMAALLVLRLAFYAPWFAWDGGVVWGTRFLLPVVPLLMIPIAFLPKGRRLRLLVVGLAALSIGIEVLAVVVPWNLYYDQVAPSIAVRLGVPLSCSGCSLAEAARSYEAINDVFHFDWRFAPLLGQLSLLRQGIIDPGWRSPVFFGLLPLILLVFAAGLLSLRRLATRLDGVSAVSGWGSDRQQAVQSA